MDDFIFIIPAFSATAEKLDQNNNGCKLLTEYLGILYQDTKDCIGTVISVFGIEIDTNHSVARVFIEKQEIAKDATKAALCKESFTFYEA